MHLTTRESQGASSRASPVLPQIKHLCASATQFGHSQRSLLRCRRARTFSASCRPGQAEPSFGVLWKERWQWPSHMRMSPPSSQKKHTLSFWSSTSPTSSSSSSPSCSSCSPTGGGVSSSLFATAALSSLPLSSSSPSTPVTERTLRLLATGPFFVFSRLASVPTSGRLSCRRARFFSPRAGGLLLAACCVQSSFASLSASRTCCRWLMKIAPAPSRSSALALSTARTSSGAVRSMMRATTS
mmetsp:Transcript_7351/g.22251  ORF Transcript_7351/g.22251 Transcript_7351/m.22251 type:complete len:242 (+) Transcript_7351:264-989(+)